MNLETLHQLGNQTLDFLSTKDTATFSQIIAYFYLEIRFQRLAIFLKKKYPKDNSIQSSKQSYSLLSQYTKLLDLFKEVKKHLPTLKVPVHLISYSFVFLKEPKGCIKLQEHKLPVSSYFTYINSNFSIVTQPNPLLLNVQRPKKKTIVQPKKTLPHSAATASHKVLLGHQSFGRSRTKRLIAEAFDPPACLVISKSNLFPPVSDFKYISSKFYFETKNTKGREACRLIIFDNKEQRNSFHHSVTSKKLKLLDCNIFEDGK